MGFSLNIPNLGGFETYEKCTIVSLDNSSLKVHAVFNPNKLKVSKSVPWNRHSPAGGDGEMLEFTNGKNRSLSFDMFFDGYEKHAPNASKGIVNVETKYVDKLLAMTQPDIPVFNGGKLAMRPHFVMIIWGKLSRIKGVLESLDTEFNMFMPDGVPVRATVSIKMTEVDPHQFLKGLAKKALGKVGKG